MRRATRTSLADSVSGPMQTRMRVGAPSPALRAAALGFVHIHQRIDALGCAAQRQFAQRDQVTLLEEILRCALLGFRRDIDFGLP